MKVALIDQNIIDEIREKQALILHELKNSSGNNGLNEKYISRKTAADLFDCNKQTIANLEKEGLIKRLGRGKMIRYSFKDFKAALGIA
jgi:hypothetical protein